MIIRIGHFSITKSSDKIVVDYIKSIKDWFDTFFVIAIGIALCFATYILLEYGITTTNYVVIGGGLIFAFQAILQSSSGISRLFQPTKNLLIINMKSLSVKSRHSPFASKTYPLHELKSFVFKRKKEAVIKVGSTGTMTRKYCVVNAIFNNKEQKRFFTINSKSFLSSDKKAESEVVKTAQKLTFELNKILKNE